MWLGFSVATTRSTGYTLEVLARTSQRFDRADRCRVQQTTSPPSSRLHHSEEWTPGTPRQFAEVVQAGYREDLAMMRRDGDVGDGFNVFQCHCCGRVYIASCET